MKARRREGGFEPIGRVGVETMGLPPRRARLLLLEHAWGRVAGSAIARRARAVRVQRGVLEVELSDPAWARELAPFLPRIAGRLARGFPELGVKRFRVRVAGEPVLPASAPELMGDEAQRRAAPAPPAPAPPTPARHGPDEVTTGRLVRAARCYLERVAMAAGSESAKEDGLEPDRTGHE